MWFRKQKINIPPGGAIPSPLDKRDVLMSEVYPLPVRIAPEMPQPFDLTILNQNGYPYCVGYSSAALKQEKELRERVSKVFDGDWIYQKCKEIDGYNGTGTYLRVAMKVLQKQGAKPKDEPESEAVKYRIGGYAKVDDLSFEGLKRAIFVNGAIIAGFTGSNAGWQNAYIRPPKEGEATWGHAVCIIGYTKDYLIFQNSWGNQWGENGLGYICANYSPFEAWAVLTDLPSEFLLPSGIEGFVAQEYLKTDKYLIGQEVYPYCNLNLRDAPAGNKIMTLQRGQKLVVLSEPIKSGDYNWIKVGIK
jgi:hypothetical protein